MAGGMDLGTSSKGGKKPLDAAINLVPFIDLMAVTIAFLIMTAVWTQIGRLQVSQAGGPADPNKEVEEPKTLPVTLLITDKELKLTYGTETFDPYPITRNDKGRIDLTKLIGKLKDIKAANAEQSAITLQTEDAVKYEDLVRIIDECIGAGMPGVSVSPAMG
jgi:biopolymer transport protein ExbD